MPLPYNQSYQKRNFRKGYESVRDSSPNFASDAFGFVGLGQATSTAPQHEEIKHDDILSFFEDKLSSYFNTNNKKLDEISDILGSIKDLLAKADKSTRDSTRSSRPKIDKPNVPIPEFKDAGESEESGGKRNWGKILGDFPGFFAKDFSLRFMKNLIGDDLFKGLGLEGVHGRVKSDYSDTLHGRNNEGIEARATKKYDVPKDEVPPWVKSTLEKDTIIIESVSGSLEKIEEALSKEFHKEEPQVVEESKETPKPYVKMTEAGKGATEGLGSLGIKKKDAKALVESVLQELGADASEADLMKAALQAKGKNLGNTDSFKKENTLFGDMLGESQDSNPAGEGITSFLKDAKGKNLGNTDSFKKENTLFGDMLGESQDSNPAGEGITSFLKDAKGIMKPGNKAGEGEIEGFSSTALDELQKRMKAAFVDATHEVEEEDSGNTEEADLRKNTDDTGIKRNSGFMKEPTTTNSGVMDISPGASSVDVPGKQGNGMLGDLLGEVIAGAIGGEIGPILASLSTAIGSLVTFLAAGAGVAVEGAAVYDQSQKASQDFAKAGKEKSLFGKVKDIGGGLARDAIAAVPGLSPSIKEFDLAKGLFHKAPVQPQTTGLVATGDRASVLTAQANGKKDHPPVVVSAPNNSQNNKTNVSHNNIFNDTARAVEKGALWLAQYG